MRVRVYYKDTASSGHMRRARAMVESVAGHQFVQMGSTPGQAEKWFVYDVPDHHAAGVKERLRVAGFRTA